MVLEVSHWLFTLAPQYFVCLDVNCLLDIPVHDSWQQESHQKDEDNSTSTPTDSTLYFSMFINDTGHIATAFWHPTLNVVGPQGTSAV